MRTSIYIAIIFATLQLGCSTVSTPQRGKDGQVTIDRPVIKNLNEIDVRFRKLQHSLVRLRIGNAKEESYGTGFFFQTNDLLVTSQHLFTDGHECLVKLSCSIKVGFAKDSKDVQEQVVQAEVILKHPSKDLIFLKIKDNAQVANVQPLMNHGKSSKGTLTAAGFYQDNPALTFSQGKNLEKAGSEELTSIIVSSGFSGSPVLNSDGDVVGVVSSYKPIKGQQIGLAQYITMDNSQ